MAINHKNGKDAVTHYKVLERFGQATYVECRLETGRTHQIRVHMASIGHPLLGDTVYGSSRNPYHLEGQALHAMILGFVHPRTGEYMEFTAPLLSILLNCCQNCENSWKNCEIYCIIAILKIRQGTYHSFAGSEAERMWLL